MRHREPSICLRTVDYSETSQVVTFLTRGCGLVRLMAKGAKRPKSSSGGAIDLLSEGELVFTVRASGGLGTLIEFTETVWHGAVRKDAETLNGALYMIELAGKMLGEDDPHPEVFDLLHNALGRLGAGGGTAAVLAYYQWRLLRHVGLLGELGVCVCCGGQIAGVPAGGEVYFCSARGGLVCHACQAGINEKLRLDGATLAGLSAISAAEAGRRVSLPDKQACAANRLLTYHITQQLGKAPRLAGRVPGAGTGRDEKFSPRRRRHTE